MPRSADLPTPSRRDFLKMSSLAGAVPLGLLLDETPPGPLLPKPIRNPEAWATARVVPPPPLPSMDVIASNRLGFGPRPGFQDAFQALGATPQERLQAYVDQQLSYATVDDAACNARLAAACFTTLNKSLTQLWADHVYNNTQGWSYRMLPITESERATWIRAVYSQRQLFEVLVDFWHNHFNVHGWHSYAGPVFVHYDRDVIRAHALGNFRQMLEAVAKSTAMLYYLDNYLNQVGGFNENFARELLELHTMGAENYLGFDGQTVQEDDLIPPVRRGGNLLHPERKARADLVSQARLDGLFGQRWKTETVNSVIKRKFGDTIRSRTRSLQRREPIIKGLVYNIHR